MGILVCMMLMAMIPVAAGAGLSYETQLTEKIICDDDPETNDGILDRTMVRGIVLFPRATRGGDFKFFAIRLHYTTITLGGVKTGSILLRSITLPNIPNGFIGNFYIIGSFRGNLDAFT